jgi:hypothetical protein
VEWQARGDHGRFDWSDWHRAGAVSFAADDGLPQHVPVNQPEVMIGNASERFDAVGNLTDDATKEFIRQLLQNLVEWTRRISQATQGT